MRRSQAIAIIGLACRFPGANDPETFFRNLCDGRESITRFSDEELLAAGVAPGLLDDPLYVKSAPVLDHADRFDAAFFGYSPREAATMDPQHRLFLEVAWEAIEAAGYDPADCPGEVGVFAGAGGVITSYLLAHPDHPELIGDTASLPYVGNDKDFIATRVSYKLNLTGPSVTVQTACSTSLVAVHLGCQSLMSGESDLVLAGASTVRVPQIRGYLAERGTVHSRNGQCQSFDADGRGVVFGSGVGAVVLRRLDDALERGDAVRAVIRGTAIGNDGADKASFPAPSAKGQARTVTRALDRAGVSADTVDYVECHAAGTWVGDPIEFDALATAFRAATRRRGFCALGSVKPNIGHPEQAAGMAGLIKTVLSMEHAKLPKNLHFDTPNPHIDFDASPFYVNTELRPWPRNGHPRRAGINSLGIGGTNAFVVLEEAPRRLASARPAARGTHVLTLSAKSAPALAASAGRMQTYLAAHPEVDPGDLCHTTNVSRSRHLHRLALAARTVEEVAKGLADRARRAPVSGNADGPRVAFLFTGQGTQHPGMGAGLYAAHPGFREALDRCDAAFASLLPRRLLEVMFAPAHVQAPIDDMTYAQPALFALEYGLATLWQAWGVRPHAVMGHSLGELVAACVAGAIDFDEAVALIAERGRLMQALPGRGAMAAVFADEETVIACLPDDGSVVVAAVNAPQNVVVSGEGGAVAAMLERLSAEGLESQPLPLPNGFHSPLVEPMFDALEAAAARACWRPAGIPLISNITGKPMVDAHAPRYWCDHARRTVRFADGVRHLDALGCDTFVEIGPGSTLVGLAVQVLAPTSHRFVASLSREAEDWDSIMKAVAALYEAGAPIDWQGVHRGTAYRRVPLPTYPFEGKRFWVAGPPTTDTRPAVAAKDPVDPNPAPWAPGARLTRPAAGDGVTRIAAALREAPVPVADPAPTLSVAEADSETWLHALRWRALPPAASVLTPATGAWVVFADAGGLGEGLAAALEGRGERVHRVSRGDAFARTAPGRWRVDPGEVDQFARLFAAVRDEDGRAPTHAVYLWGLDAASLDDLAPQAMGDGIRGVARGALSLCRAAQTARASTVARPRVHLVTRNAFEVEARDPPAEALQGLLWGLGRSFALESPELWGGLVDLGARAAADDGACAALVDELLSTDGEDQVARRGSRRFAPRLNRTGAPPAPAQAQALPFRPDATYVITGGLGMIGLETARYLVQRAGVRSLVLAGRNAATVTGAAAVDALRARGARVQVVAADVSTPEDVKRLLAPAQGVPSIRGIVHCAGLLDNALLAHMDWAQFERATMAKAVGALLLDRYTRDLPLDVFVLQSSLLGVIGSPGQANYTAANAVLDALGQRRRAQGRAATVINWSAWSGGGLAAAAGEENVAAWREQGLEYLEASHAMGAFHRIMTSGAGQTVVAAADWTAYARQFPEPPPLYAELVAAGGLAPAEPGADTPPAPGSRDELVALLREHVSDEMGFDEPLDPLRPLGEVGLHSLLAAALANRLSQLLDFPVALVMLVRGPSIAELADELWAALRARDTSAPASDAPVAPAASRRASVARIETSRVAGDGWLVFQSPNPGARMRLFCFPYAGGNSATYRPWVDRLDPDIELVAIEPPGRAERITEAPIANLDEFFTALLPAITPYLDRPFAFFGHCLGGLTLFEAARRLRHGGPSMPDHLFVSAARPPQSLLRIGRFEEELLERLLALEGFDPFKPHYEQPEDVFSELIRHFNIGLSEEFLASAELRRLLMPVIRAEFTMASHYRYRAEPPLDIPISCFAGKDDPYASRDDVLGWSEHTACEYRLHLREGDHFLVADDRDYIISMINRELRP